MKTYDLSGGVSVFVWNAELLWSQFSTKRRNVPKFRFGHLVLCAEVVSKLALAGTPICKFDKKLLKHKHYRS